MDVYGGGKKEMSLADVRAYLMEHIRKDAEVYFGIRDHEWVEQVIANWFNGQYNYDGRWKVIKERIPVVGRVLDMAAGCGTFVLYGLKNGYDVWGLEPEKWKMEYFKRKILAHAYPKGYLNHMIAGFGEALPFKDESFDLVTTYQTLEHVSDINKCIQEMLRVLKPGGILYIKAPDYNSFFEPHYRVPFLPKMNKKLASLYLKFIGRPILGLQRLQWATKNKVLNILKASNFSVNIEETNSYYVIRRQKKIKELPPNFLRCRSIISALNLAYEMKCKVMTSIKVLCARQEGNIDLWVTKKG